MLRRIFLLLIMCVTALSVSACTTSHDYKSELTCEHFAANSHRSDSFTLEVGDKLRLELCSDQAAGYGWDYEFTTQNVVKEEDRDYREPQQGSAAGVELWTFEGVGKGTTEIQMGYRQASQGGSQAEWTYTITVTVQ